MRSPLEIRNDAWDCLQQAERAEAQRHKAVLLILAQGWASLADEMERLSASVANDDTIPADEAPGDATRAAVEAHRAGTTPN